MKRQSFHEIAKNIRDEILIKIGKKMTKNLKNCLKINQKIPKVDKKFIKKKKKKICENFFSEKCYPKKKLKIFKILVYIGNPIVFSKFKKKTSIF